MFVFHPDDVQRQYKNFLSMTFIERKFFFILPILRIFVEDC